MSNIMHTVTSLVHYIKTTLDQDFHLRGIQIKGEISNLTKHRSGHWYFSLKDNRAKIDCVMFASYASRCKLNVQTGMSVIVTGSISMYEANGNVQVYVTSIESEGLGALYLKLEEVKQNLAREGLFANEHKKLIPKYCMNIAVVTAKSGDAIRDVLSVISRRWPMANVTIYSCLVQGAMAHLDIIRALCDADKNHHEVILLVRGGGAIEDLWCYNEEALARCVFECQTPIVTGVGHERDVTLVDYVSDQRAATPTAAAELVTADIQEVKMQLMMQKHKMTQIVNEHLKHARLQLQFIQKHRYIKDPQSFIAPLQVELAMNMKAFEQIVQNTKIQRQKLLQIQTKLAMHASSFSTDAIQQVENKQQALQYSMEQFIYRYKSLFIKNSALLDAFSPLKILGRGYNIAYQNDKLVKSICDVVEQSSLDIHMQDGIIHTIVVDKEETSWKKK